MDRKHALQAALKKQKSIDEMRARNRVSAQKCRERLKQRRDELRRDISELEDRRDSLNHEMKLLKYEMQTLVAIASDHKTKCRLETSGEDVKPVFGQQV